MGDTRKFCVDMIPSTFVMVLMSIITSTCYILCKKSALIIKHMSAFGMKLVLDKAT